MNKRNCSIGYFEWENPAIIKFVATLAEPDENGMQDFGKVWVEILRELKGKYVVIVDISEVKWMSGSARITGGQVIKEVEHTFQETYIRTYLVIPNVMVNMMLKGINLISKPIIPQTITQTLDEAVMLAEKEISSMRGL